MVKNPPANAGDVGFIPGSGRDPLEKEMAAHATVLTWEIPWIEEPGGYSPLLLSSILSRSLQPHPLPHAKLPCPLLISWSLLQSIGSQRVGHDLENKQQLKMCS